MFVMDQESDSRGTLTRTMVYLVNHGESEAGDMERISERGKNQIFELARSRLIAGISKIYMSPSKVCTESGNILAKEFYVRAEKSDCIKEINLGQKSSVFKDLLENLEGMWDDSSIGPDKGESFLEARRRIGDCITKLAKKNSGNSVAIVSHPVVCLLFDTLVCGGEINQESLLSLGYASCASYEYSKDGWVMVMPFENSFLSEPTCISDITSDE